MIAHNRTVGFVKDIEPKHVKLVQRKKQKLERKYVLQYRVKPDIWEEWQIEETAHIWSTHQFNNWRTWRKYPTLHSRKQALEYIDNHPNLWRVRNYEYRIV